MNTYREDELSNLIDQNHKWIREEERRGVYREHLTLWLAADSAKILLEAQEIGTKGLIGRAKENVVMCLKLLGTYGWRG